MCDTRQTRCRKHVRDSPRLQYYINLQNFIPNNISLSPTIYISIINCTPPFPSSLALPLTSTQTIYKYHLLYTNQPTNQPTHPPQTKRDIMCQRTVYAIHCHNCSQPFAWRAVGPEERCRGFIEWFGCDGTVQPRWVHILENVCYGCLVSQLASEPGGSWVV
jgi:hypothetical protein